MLSASKIQAIMGMLLLAGIYSSAIFVCLGGILFLMQHGSENIQAEWLHLTVIPTSRFAIWQLALSFTPLGIIELGLLLLVFTQIVRVALLVGFYAAIRDYWFTLISAFVLFVLVYSMFWRK